MSQRTKSRVHLAVLGVLVAVGLVAGYRGLGSADADDGCKRSVSYTLNWGGDTRASRVQWGPVGNTESEHDVGHPWQKINIKTRCSTVVMLHVEFVQPVTNLLCALTVGNEVHQSDFNGKTHRCFEQILVA